MSYSSHAMTLKCWAKFSVGRNQYTSAEAHEARAEGLIATYIPTYIFYLSVCSIKKKKTKKDGGEREKKRERKDKRALKSE